MGRARIARKQPFQKIPRSSIQQGGDAVEQAGFNFLARTGFGAPPAKELAPGENIIGKAQGAGLTLVDPAVHEQHPDEKRQGRDLILVEGGGRCVDLPERLNRLEELAHSLGFTRPASGKKAEFRIENLEPVADDVPASQAVGGENEARLVAMANDKNGPEPPNFWNTSARSSRSSRR